MNKVLRAVCLALAFVTGAGAQDSAKTNEVKKAPRDALVFKNGDILYGELGGITSTNGINWKRPDALSAFEFNPGQVAEITLGSENQGGITSSNLCTVHLHNGDQFQGTLSSFDGEKLSVETWFGGNLQLPKENVAMILPVGLPKTPIFEGPTSLEGWTMGKVNAAAVIDSGDWLYHNAALYAVKSASIARDVDLPDSASFSFDLEWRGFFHVAIALYTEYLHPVNLANKETEPKFGGFYSMQINPFSANLLPVKQNDPLRYLGQAPLQTLASKNSAHFDIRMSKSRRIIALLIDGALVKQWVDSEEFAGTGKAIRFVHQGQGAVKLSNIKVTEWDGTFEEPPTVTPNKKTDLARLKNGDRIPGAVKEISDGKMKVEGAGQVLEIPLTRVKQIEFATARAGRSNWTPQTVRAYFAKGGSVTFELERWSEELVQGTSPFYGPVSFKTAAFNRLVFDPTADAVEMR